LPAAAATAAQPLSGAEPADLEATFQIINLARDWALLGELIPAGTEGVELFELELQVAARAALGEVLGTAVDLSSSIDVAFANPAPGATSSVVSVRVRDFERTRRGLEADFALVPRAQGGIELRPKGTGRTGTLLTQSHGCELHRDPAGPDARLICGEGDDMRQDYLSYLLSLARQPARAESSVVVHVPSRKWKEFSKGVAGADVPESDGERLGRELMSEAVNEIDRVVVDARLGRGESDLGVELGISSTRSLLSSFLLSHASQRPLPDAFWDAPRDALFALQWEGMAPGARRDDVAALMRRLAQAEPDLDPSGRDAMAKANARVMFRGGPIWIVSGCDLDRASSALRDYLGNTSSDQALVAARDELSGWTLVGMPDPLEHWKAALREQTEVWARFGRRQKVVPASGTKGGGKGPPAPVLRGAPTSPDLSQLTEVPVTAADKLPPGTVHFVYETFLNADYRPPPDSQRLRSPSKQHLLFVEKAGHTWICFSSSLAVCAEHVRGLIRGGAGTLRERAATDLAPLLGARGPVVGFVSPAGLVWFSTDASTLDELRESRSAIAALSSLPKGGRTAWTLVGSSSAIPGATHGRLRLGLHASNDDLLSAFIALAASNED
jgi:hypothetical protein